MASIKGFLTTYFKQMHFNAMSPEVRARWAEYLKLPDLTNSMKDWRNQLMEKQADGTYTAFPLPKIEKGHNPTREGDGKPGDPGLTDDQIKDLYTWMNDTVSAMAEDKKIKNAEFVVAKTFVDDFYGKDANGNPKIFDIVPVTTETKDKLKDLVKQPDGLFVQLKVPIQRAISYAPFDGEKKPTYQEIIDGIKDGKYDKDSTFRQTLITLFGYIGTGVDKDFIDPKVADALRQWTQNGLSEELQNGLKPEPSKMAIDRFKRNYGQVLERLYKKSKAKDIFKAHDSNGIISALETAREEVNYDKEGQENFLYPKVEEHLNFGQRIKKKIDDYYDNHLDKYFNNFGGDRMFRSKPAKDIVKGIKKEKIKPTDGLDAILKKSEDIKKHMAHESTSTGTHFDWLLKELKVIKDADDKAFEACLRNGVSLRGVVQRLIMDAVKQDKIAHAKTALEVLSVIKYENTTSKTLDAIKADKELFTFFSNKDLSWNRSEGVQFVTKALDKTIRVAGIAVATGATFVVNSLRKMGSRIRSENEELGDAHRAFQKENDDNKKELADKLAQSNKRMADAENRRNNLGDKKDIDDNFNAADKFVKDIVTKLQEKELKELGDIAQNSDDDEELTEDKIKEKMAAQKWLAAITAYINGSGPRPDPDALAKGSPNKVTDIGKKAIEYLDKNNFERKNRDLSKARDKKQAYADATLALSTAKAELDANQKEIDDYDKNHMDRYQELINYWNDLERGRDSHLRHYSRMPGNKKTKQNKFFLDWNNGIPKKDEYTK